MKLQAGAKRLCSSDMPTTPTEVPPQPYSADADALITRPKQWIAPVKLDVPRMRTAAGTAAHRQAGLATMQQQPWYKLIQAAAAVDQRLTHVLHTPDPLARNHVSKRDLERL